ncbi:MAG: hypothetical protein SGI73_21150 [Chloroflexota bacterium]|nr:hypothetical protein [Chloroflexota bacterium]
MPKLTPEQRDDLAALIEPFTQIARVFLHIRPVCAIFTGVSGVVNPCRMPPT